MPTAEPRRERGRLLPVLSLAAVLLGGAGIVCGLLVSMSHDGDPPPSDRADARTATDEAPVPSAPQAPVASGPEVDSVIDPQWLARTAEAAGIPERALLAYAEAASRAAREHPNCGLGWNTLAGIGFVESEHGTIHGSRIGADGVATPAIVGVPLDGNATEAIPDTDGGALDGDAVWDRAIGPMQFIPSTWAVWGSDGDGDGAADPQSIDDAAYSAARYLCVAAHDLREPSQWIRAIAAYNDTVHYNRRVAEAASFYASVSG